MFSSDRPVIIDYLEFEASSSDAGKRLDVFVAANSDFSRTTVGRLAKQGLVAVNGEVRSPSQRLSPGDVVGIEVPEQAPSRLEPEPIPLDILYEDEDIAAVFKPPGMAVHPSPGHATGTLASALLYHFNHLSTVQGLMRPGIVHRLDKDTSGVILVAKNDRAHELLARQFKERTIKKEYVAVVHGVPVEKKGSVSRPIGQSLHGVGEMAVDGIEPKKAHTDYEILDIAGQFSLIRAFPLTGRTHQIRVHLAHVGLPILCDTLYGRESVFRRKDIPGWEQAGGGREPEAVLLGRQALHAARISFHHPVSRYPMLFEAPLPEDMSAVWNELRGALTCAG